MGTVAAIAKVAKVALGDAFNDNGAIFPAVGPKAGDDWQGIDISFSDLKKLYPTFDWKAVKEWKGNIMSFLAGGVTGQAFAFDAIYFYQLGDGSGINDIVEMGHQNSISRMKVAV